jgi:hypothetical protein
MSDSMRLIVVLLSILVFASLSAQANDTPTFAITSDELKTRLNAIIKADTTAGPADILSKCEKKSADQVCSFKDGGFQRSVGAFKEMNLANGRFFKAVRLEISTANGKVSEIRLKGSRGDPINVFDFLSNVVDTAKVFDSKVGADDASLKAFVDGLGLMRGDSADDIGKTKMTIEPYAEIRCLAVNSHISTDVTCVFIPRS